MIKEEVIEGHLQKFGNEISLLRRLETDFDITWANRVLKFNTEISVYFLKPLNHISQAFGFEQELLMAVSNFPHPEARLIQSIEQTFEQLPAKGRVDQTVAIVVSSATDIRSWVQEYIASNPQGRAYVGIPLDEFIENNDRWFLRNAFVSQLFSRDLFDYTLPLNEDMFFFGRQAIVAEHVDAIRKSENRGIFGLRKTGKTSILFKVRRQCVSAEINVLYYDCKLSSIYRLGGDDLIDKIIIDIETIFRCKIDGWRGKKFAADRFMSLIQNLPDNKRLCLMFDEIEYVSPGSLTAPHWKDDFIPFWQAIWSTQSQFRKFCFIIAGVNASVVETDKFSGIQNPMFGIVRPRYLTGFEKGELFSLLSVFGKRMGLRFGNEAVDLLYSRYGGHPLLTRMICSQINNEIKVSGVSRPVLVSKKDIKKDIANREQEIEFYCGHITSELEQFYIDEYEVLELLASGNVKDFNDMAEDVGLVRHLKSYGLVDFSVPFMPKFAIPVIQGYISSKWKKKSGQKSDRYVVPQHRRAEYVTGRVSSVLRDLRVAERRFTSKGMSQLYRGSGPAEAELFAAISPVSSRDDAVSFLNQCSRSIVEPLDLTGSVLNKPNYFFGVLKVDFPRLWPAFNRIRAYRNGLMHAVLNGPAQQAYDSFLDEDFDGSLPDNTIDGWFRLQSSVLDGLVIGIQAELAVYD